jgi:hypothetical protein
LVGLPFLHNDIQPLPEWPLAAAAARSFLLNGYDKPVAT